MKKTKSKFDWYFGDGCRYHLHGFAEGFDGEKCRCGLTIIRQRNGGWDAVWNTQGVGFPPKKKGKK